MKTNKKFIPVMLMPFLEDGNIDYLVLNQLVELYISAGAQGLFANCLSSEMFQLDKEEMLKSVEFIVKTVAGRIPIVATGTFGGTIESQAEFVNEIYKTGISCVIVISSLLAKETDSEATFQQNVTDLLRLTSDTPLGFYECPLPYKRVLHAEFLGQLVKSGRIKYHKDTSLDMRSVNAKLEATEDVADFGLYDAYMIHAVESLKAGSAGLSCIQGNYFPELVVWLCDNYNNQAQANTVEAVQNFFTANMDLMHDTYPTSAKYVLNKRGVPMTLFCRTRKESLTNDNILHLDKLYNDFENLCERNQLFQK